MADSVFIRFVYLLGEGILGKKLPSPPPSDKDIIERIDPPSQAYLHMPHTVQPVEPEYLQYSFAKTC